ncbi:MAG TPA: helix-turn-helix transcriptional regulator [Chloroflexota bacterium]|nr:helix-turn-helix transcriptional regulator [Chloroflexota bacterium]
MRTEILKGHVDLLLLAAVLARPSHGYAVIEELRRRSDGAFDLPEGTVYPALHRLERQGLLASQWSEETGRKRRIYAVTERGRTALAQQRQDWSLFARAVQAVVTEA